MGTRQAAEHVDRPGDGGEGGPRAAIDALAFVLETIGEFAFDLGDLSGEEIRALSRQWSEHLVAASRTNHPVQWDRFRAFFRPLRQREHSSINRSLGELKATVRLLVESIRDAITGDREGDANIQANLGTLERVVEGDDVAKIREEAASAIRAIGTVLEERQRRQRLQLRQIRDLQDKLAQAHRAADRDGLTRLYNRRAFDRELHRRAARRRHGRTQCLLMIDGDHFKGLNDTHGHPAGDAVLKAIAEQCRRAFERGDDFVARYGGEEFAILADVDHEDSAYALGLRLLLAIREMRVEHGGRSLRITVSIGVAMLRPEEDAAGWLARADAALYAAKGYGRDRVVLAADD